MRLKAITRLLAIQKHLQPISTRTSATSATPTITVNPATCMVDEEVHIQVTGLQPRQFVTLVSQVVENKTTFEARGVYKANTNGTVDLQKNASLAGTYTGADPMGLFWSVKSLSDVAGGDRLTKKDVTSPSVYTLTLFDDVIERSEGDMGQQTPVAEAKVERCYMRDGLTRVPIRDGKLRGTIFIPEGPGPFPALIDMSGAAVSINETRASVLASSGYAVFTLTYLYVEHLPKNLMSADLSYILDAIKYFLERPYVDKTRFGAIGVCFGGLLSLIVASLLPEIRAVIDIGGVPILPVPIDETVMRIPTRDCTNAPWPSLDNVYVTDEGVVINGMSDCPNPHIVPAWQHGAKLLFIWGEDDKQVHPKWFPFYKNNMPAEYRHRAEFYSYPGTGHLIEVPYMPHCRSNDPGRIKSDETSFIPVGHKDKRLMSGGVPIPHSFAQIDAWKKILAFLHRELGS